MKPSRESLKIQYLRIAGLVAQLVVSASDMLGHWDVHALLEINKRNFPLQFYFFASYEAAPFMQIKYLIPHRRGSFYLTVFFP